MSIRTGTTDYYLKRPFPYKNPASTKPIDATFITLREPTADHQEGFWIMRQYIRRAEVSAMKLLSVVQDSSVSEIIGSQTEKFHNTVDRIEEEDSADESKNDEGFSTIILAGEVDIVKFMNTFKKMVTTNARKSLALVDGEESVPLNAALMGKMNPDDLLGLAIRWCAFFIMSEDTGAQTSSDEYPGQHAQAKED